MSKPSGAAARGKNRLNPEDFAGMLAPKGAAAGAVTGTEPRSLQVVKPPPVTAAIEAIGPAPARKRFSTSLDFPDYVDEQITAWLRNHPEHVFKTMIMHALSGIGLSINQEDLVPQRRRRR